MVTAQGGAWWPEIEWWPGQGWKQHVVLKDILLTRRTQKLQNDSLWMFQPCEGMFAFSPSFHDGSDMAA